MVWKNLNLRNFAKTNRKNQTPEEKKLRYAMLYCPQIPHFKRQEPIGNYIADFVFLKHKLIIECDGSQHYTEEGTIHDKERTAIIESEGIKIIRFSNLEINKQFKSVCEYIDNEIRERAC